VLGASVARIYILAACGWPCGEQLHASHMVVRAAFEPAFCSGVAQASPLPRRSGVASMLLPMGPRDVTNGAWHW